MRKLFALIVLLTLSVGSFAQKPKPAQNKKVCELLNLSDNFDYTIKIKWADSFDISVPGNIEIIALSKADTPTLQTINANRDLMGWIYDSFSCVNIRSFLTGVNVDSPAIDYDWGNFVVRDFNFDGNEDFAIKVSDNNSGPAYQYFVQYDGKFVADDFLTDSVSFMIDRFDTANNEAYLSLRSGCCWTFHYTYKYNDANRNWKTIARKEEGTEPE